PVQQELGRRHRATAQEAPVHRRAPTAQGRQEDRRPDISRAGGCPGRSRARLHELPAGRGPPRNAPARSPRGTPARRCPPSPPPPPIWNAGGPEAPPSACARPGLVLHPSSPTPSVGRGRSCALEQAAVISVGLDPAASREVKRHSGWFIALGVALVVLGVIAL